MIRTTDAMMKSVIVQKKKEMLKSDIDAFQKAMAAGRHDIAKIFAEWIKIGEKEVFDAMEMLKNPAA